MQKGLHINCLILFLPQIEMIFYRARPSTLFIMILMRLWQMEVYVTVLCKCCSIFNMLQFLNMSEFKTIQQLTTSSLFHVFIQLSKNKTTPICHFFPSFARVFDMLFCRNCGERRSGSGLDARDFASAFVGIKDAVNEDVRRKSPRDPCGKFVSWLFGLFGHVTVWNYDVLIFGICYGDSFFVFFGVVGECWGYWQHCDLSILGWSFKTAKLVLKAGADCVYIIKV